MLVFSNNHQTYFSWFISNFKPSSAFLYFPLTLKWHLPSFLTSTKHRLQLENTTGSTHDGNAQYDWDMDVMLHSRGHLHHIGYEYLKIHFCFGKWLSLLFHLILLDNNVMRETSHWALQRTQVTFCVVCQVVDKCLEM